MEEPGPKVLGELDWLLLRKKARVGNPVSFWRAELREDHEATVAKGHRGIVGVNEERVDTRANRRIG